MIIFTSKINHRFQYYLIVVPIQSILITTFFNYFYQKTVYLSRCSIWQCETQDRGRVMLRTCLTLICIFEWKQTILVFLFPISSNFDWKPFLVHSNYVYAVSFFHTLPQSNPGIRTQGTISIESKISPKHSNADDFVLRF